MLRFGAGNISRGVIGRIFAVAGYEARFVDMEESVVVDLDGLTLQLRNLSWRGAVLAPVNTYPRTCATTGCVRKGVDTDNG